MRTLEDTILPSLSYEQITGLIAKMSLAERKKVLFFTQATLYDNKTNPLPQWEKDAIEMHRAGDDKLLIPDSFNDENLDWWECCESLSKNVSLL